MKGFALKKSLQTHSVIMSKKHSDIASENIQFVDKLIFQF